MGVDGASAGGDPSRETICRELAAKHGWLPLAGG